MSLHYLVKYKFSKIAQTEAEQQQTKRTKTKENVIMLDKLVLSQQNQAQIYHSVHQTAKAGVIQVIFHGDLDSKCLKRRLLKN